MKKITSTFAEGCSARRADPSIIPDEAPPLMANGRAAAAASVAAIGATTRNDGAVFVTIQLYLDRHGIYLPLTPLGAREWAASLMRAADDAESMMAPAANAQLAATLNKGNPV